MSNSFRALYKWLVPGWLADEADGERVLWSLSAVVDASVERVRQGLIARFPAADVR
jgi:hypothetical protein